MGESWKALKNVVKIVIAAILAGLKSTKIYNIFTKYLNI